MGAFMTKSYLIGGIVLAGITGRIGPESTDSVALASS